MPRQLTSARVLVTGASSGVGLAAARAFAREGADVAVLARRLEGLEKAAEMVRGHGGRALALRCDVSDQAALDEAVARVVDVHYEDLKDDIIGVARRVYEHAGRPFDADTEQAMRDWDANHPQYQLGKFEYSLERYGFTEDQIRSEFADYIERFGRRHGA